MKHFDSLVFLGLLLIASSCFPISSTEIISNTVASSSTPNKSTSMTTAILPSNTPLPTVTQTSFNTLEPAQIIETLQPLLKNPMNCNVPCFWGIIPGKTHLDEIRIFFNRLGFITREGNNFYSVGYKPNNGDGFSAIFYTSDTLVKSIEVTPYIAKQAKEGNHQEWIAYSPETLIKRYGSPSHVQFSVNQQQSVTIDMIIYFDISDLIVQYSGYNMTPEKFCPLMAPFDFVRLWIGPNPLNIPSFDTLPLEEATSLTMDQFVHLITGDPKKACFAVRLE